MAKIPNIDIAIDSSLWVEEAHLRQITEKAVRAAAYIAKLNWPKGAELSLVFTDDSKISQINDQWRNKAKPTNVLSFPGAEIQPDQNAGFFLGDIVLAYETIAREADEQEKRFDDHLSHLIVHGFLHLFGYDHMDESEAKTMEALEKKILAYLGIEDPYA